MTRSRAIAAVSVVVVTVILCWFGVTRYRVFLACKQRRAAFDARADALEKAARTGLKVGSKRNELVWFFVKNEISLSVVGSLATGDIHTTGCAPIGCTSDEAIIGLRVEINEAGTVTSEPVVVRRYTSCY